MPLAVDFIYIPLVNQSSYLSDFSDFSDFIDGACAISGSSTPDSYLTKRLGCTERLC